MLKPKSALISAPPDDAEMPTITRRVSVDAARSLQNEQRTDGHIKYMVHWRPIAGPASDDTAILTEV